MPSCFGTKEEEDKNDVKFVNKQKKLKRKRAALAKLLKAIGLPPIRYIFE